MMVEAGEIKMLLTFWFEQQKITTVDPWTRWKLGVLTPHHHHPNWKFVDNFDFPKTLPVIGTGNITDNMNGWWTRFVYYMYYMLYSYNKVS